MKLTFFLIAFFLILLRVYFSSYGLGHRRADEGNMVISSDNYIEKINWSGKFRLSDDEKSIAGISPGGYLKFRENDTKLTAESNLQGEIAYTLFDGHKSLNLDDSGRQFIATVLQKMISLGFYAEGRPERILKKGGNKALLAELPRIKLDVTKEPYFDLLFKSDSLTKDELEAIIQQIDSSGSDVDKQNCLNRFTTDQLRDSALAQDWLGAVDRLGPDFEKQNLLAHFIGQRPVSGATYDSLLGIIGHLGGDFEKQDLYKKLMDDSLTTDNQWIRLIGATVSLGADFGKTDMLLLIAKKMPADEDVRAAYKKAAKTITDDNGYGKVMRAVE